MAGEPRNGDRADARERYVREGLEMAARLADSWASQNRVHAAIEKRRANRLGDDPFSHGEMAEYASQSLDAAAQEAGALADAIRALEVKDEQEKA